MEKTKIQMIEERLAIHLRKVLNLCPPVWISINDRLPEDDETYLITDGKYIATGWYEKEYFADDPKEKLQYSCATWHQDGQILVCDCCGWASVTHWMKLPDTPKLKFISA